MGLEPTALPALGARLTVGAMSLQPFTAPDPWLGRIPTRSSVLGYLSHLLGPEGSGSLPMAGEWPSGLRIASYLGQSTLEAAVRALHLVALGRRVPGTTAAVLASTQGPVGWCEGPTWAVVGIPGDMVIGLMESHPGMAFDMTADSATQQALAALVSTLVTERERARDLEPLTRPPLRGLPPLTA